MRIAKTLLTLGLACTALPALADLADEAKALIAAGKAGEAYALINSQPQALGEPLVDFYLGIAATDSGHADEGVMALERYILNFPGNVPARIELARALFVAGDNERARDEFLSARQASTSAAEVATIDRYLEAIRNREATYRPTWKAHIEVGGGYDSNVNGGIVNPNITIPTFPYDITILDSGIRQHDTFKSLDIGASGSLPVAPGLLLQGGLGAYLKANNTENTYDQRTATGRLGLAWLRGDTTYTLGASREQLDVDNHGYRAANMLNAGVLHQLDDFQSIALGLQAGHADYSGTSYLRDAEVQGATLSWRRAFSQALQPVLTLQYHWGRERNQNVRPDLGRESSGGRAALAITPAARWSVSGGVSWLNSDYSGEDTLMLYTRRDRYQAFDLNAAYHIDKHWTIKGSIVSSHNASNIALYDFRRDLAEVKLRYDF